MVSNEYGDLDNSCIHSSERSEEVSNHISIHTVAAGNSLILALEDMMEALGGGSFSYITDKTLSLNELKSKVIKIKSLFNEFLRKLRTAGTDTPKNFEVEIRSLQHFGEIYMDEVLTDWQLISEADKVIDSTHEICYKIRELIRKIEKQQKNI